MLYITWMKSKLMDGKTERLKINLHNTHMTFLIHSFLPSLQTTHYFQTKMSKKSYALNKAQIVDLCNFFNLTLEKTKDEPKMDKDTCIDRLLDFLGGPHKDWLIAEEGTKKTKAAVAAAPKKPAAPKKKPTKKAVTAAPKAAAAPPKNTTKSDYGKIKEATGKGIAPTEEVLRAWVRSYVACFNLDKATTKHAIITCSEKFGVDMSKKKQHIKQLLAEEL
jgi:hypothetical protein